MNMHYNDRLEEYIDNHPFVVAMIVIICILIGGLKW